MNKYGLCAFLMIGNVIFAADGGRRSPDSVMTVSDHMARHNISHEIIKESVVAKLVRFYPRGAVVALPVPNTQKGLKELKANPFDWYCSNCDAGAVCSLIPGAKIRFRDVFDHNGERTAVVRFEILENEAFVVCAGINKMLKELHDTTAK